MWRKQFWRSSHLATAEVRPQEVAQLLLAQPGEVSCLVVIRAANTWARDAVAEGRLRPDVERQLDAWAVELCGRSASPVRRIGLRLHPAARLRMR